MRLVADALSGGLLRAGGGRSIRALGPFAGEALLIAVPLLLIGSGLGAPAVAPAVAVIGGLLLLGSAILMLRHARRLAAANRELAAIRDGLDTQMRRDPLTGLLNRAAFHDALETATGGHGPICVLFFDLDKFKDVNDTLGHRIGDEVLVAVARRAEQVVAGTLAFARLGGDEFAAIMRFDPARSPETIGLALVEAISDPLMIDGKVIDIGASVGIAIGDPDVDSAVELLRRADIAMYEAKASRRGACRIFDDALDSRQSLESSIRVELSQSIAKNELALVYQPLIDARSGTLASVEALLRWKSCQIGDVSPATLIPIAEESGHIVEITEWTLDTALNAIKALDNVGVAVNISPVYFRSPEFVHRVFDKLLAARVSPELLTLEITEGVLIANLEDAKLAIARLRDMGVKVFLDDFGTGYSSLSYLQHFTLDGLKLDKSFLRNVGEKRQATQIIRTMINFGHSLDMKVVVEGVENDWQARLLQLLGCDYLQGYEVGVPTSIADIIKLKGQERAISLLADDERRIANQLAPLGSEARG